MRAGEFGELWRSGYSEGRSWSRTCPVPQSSRGILTSPQWAKINDPSSGCRETDAAPLLFSAGNYEEEERDFAIILLRLVNG